MAFEPPSVLNKNSIGVFEALYGDKDGALALLQCPSEMRDFFLRLSDKVDLPDSPPPGANWSPFVRGWHQEEWYVVSLTSPDSAAVRPGMVKTRMFVVKLQDIIILEDMGWIFEALHQKIEVYFPNLEIRFGSTIPVKSISREVLECIGYRLLQDEKPIAIIGQDHFEAIVCEVWRFLSPELRRIFRFGFSFTPVDLSVAKSNLVAVPKICAGRWIAYDFKCGSKWETLGGEGRESVFLNGANSEEVFHFIREIGLIIDSFSDYGRYLRLWHYWQKRNDGEIEVLFALLRGFGSFVSNPDQAKNYKLELMRLAADLLEEATAEDILGLRSVKAASFPFRAQLLGEGVERRIIPIINKSNDCGRGLTKILLALPSSQSAEWQLWISRGLKRGFSVIDRSTAEVIWEVWNTDGIFSAIKNELPLDSGSENAFIQTFPQVISERTLVLLKVWLAGRGWMRLLAKVTLHEEGFDGAIRMLLEVGDDKSWKEAAEFLCGSVEPVLVWYSAFTYGDPVLIDCAVEAGLIDPSLWGIDGGDVNRWLELVERAASLRKNFLVGGNTVEVKEKLISAWRGKRGIKEEVCEALKSVNQLQFSNIGDRDFLWKMLPKKYLGAAINNTLKFWLVDFYSRDVSEFFLEDDLSNNLFVPDCAEFVFPLDSSRLGIGGLMLLERWGAERDFEKWVEVMVKSSSRLSPDVGKRAGQLLLRRHWSHAAKMVRDLDDRKGRIDFRIIWKTYFDSLNRLERLAFNYLPVLSSHSSDSIKYQKQKNMLDAVFVTALPEEYSAVCVHLVDRQEYIEQGTVYDIGKFEVDGEHYTVVVVQTGMGNALSAAATERALNHFSPDFAFFVGIAGGLRDDLKVGDVVAASKVYGYESGKSGVTFQPRPDTPHVSHEAEQRAQAVARGEAWVQRIIPAPVALPSAIVRPIAAGEKVLVSESSEDLRRVRATYTDAYAVAMEDHGFATAVRAHPKVCFAVVRSISDLIENKDEADRSGSHEIAASSASAFAFEMLAGLFRGRRKK